MAKKTGGAWAFAALAGLGAFLLFGRKAKAKGGAAPAEPDEPIVPDEPLDPEDPAPVPDGPPVEPAPKPAPKQGKYNVRFPSPKVAPAANRPMEGTAAYNAVLEFRQGEVSFPKSKLQTKLTDRAYVSLYGNQNLPIPKGWNAPPTDVTNPGEQPAKTLAWQRYVDAWVRLYNHVGDWLEDTSQ